MNSEEYIVFGQPDLHQEDIDEVVDTLRSKWIGTGPKTHLFEKEFAAYKNISSDNVVAVNSCTAALHLSLIAAGISEGDEVITTGMTFCATVNAIHHSGATPIVVDITPDTFNICPERIVEKITKKTKAIIPVHFAGTPCDMKSIQNIAEKYGLKIIEDCAHAIESEYFGFKAGTKSDFGCFSFYVTKNLTTSEGGMIIAKNSSDAKRIRTLALHGLSSDAWQRFSDKGYKHYSVNEPGFKYNMTDLQAALGVNQINRIDKNLLTRKKQFHNYQKGLNNLPLQLPASTSTEIQTSYHLYPILVNQESKYSRDELIVKLHEKNIGTGVHYQSILSHPFYNKIIGKKCNTPIANTVGKRTISLPLSPALKKEHQERVIYTMQELLA